MPIYNCPIIGDGSDNDPFRPSIVDLPDISSWQFIGGAPEILNMGDRVNIGCLFPVQLPVDSNIYIVGI